VKSQVKNIECEIKVFQRDIHLGYFHTLEEAVQARNEEIYIDCAEKEKLDKDYEKAVKAEMEEIKEGN
jgi:hypothetical protein